MKDLIAQDIKAMLAEGENVNVEFKECGKAFPQEAWPTYSAFANTHGGWIILGVKEHKDKELPEKFEIIGISDTSKILKEFTDQLDNPQKVNRNLLTDDDISVISVDGKNLIVIYVPEADYRQKPIYLRGNKVNHSYKRTFEGDKHLTDDDLAIMIRDSYPGDNDLTLMEHYDMRHIDTETLRKYRTAFNLHNPGHVFSDLEDKEFLVQLGGYLVDEATGKEGLTLAGVLMFGKGLIVRNLFPNLRMDYLDLSNIPEGSSLKWNERLTYDGSWENNLYNFSTYVLGKIAFGIPVAGVVKGTVREDDNAVIQALRESVTNGIIHSDFRVEGVLRIEKRNNAFEFRNPGTLKLSRDKIYHGKYTKARNPKIQDMLRMIGFGDNIGSGFPLILKAWKEESWIKPDLNEDRELNEVSLKLKMVSLYAPEVIEELKEMFGERFESLGADEKECLVLIANHKCRSNSDLQEMAEKNGWEINRILNALVLKGFLISHPNGRWTTYEVNSHTNSHTNPQDNQQNRSNSHINSHINSHTAPQQILEMINSNIQLSEIQKNILREMLLHPSVSQQRLSEIIGIKKHEMRYQREKMKPIVQTKHIGANKSGYWQIEFK